MKIMGRIGLLLLSFAVGIGVAQARGFTIASWGGGYQDHQRETQFAPFGKLVGIEVLEDNYQGGWGQFQAMQDTGVVPFDVVQIEAAEANRACEEGILVELDWSRIAPKDSLVPLAVHECGVGQTSWATVVTYNEDTIGEAPTQAEDFWNIDKWPGKRGLRKGPKFNMEFALMADGVAPEDVYDVLSGEGGVDRVFNKMNEIKDLIVWWTGGAQPGEMVTSGEVTMSMGYSNRIANERAAGKPEGFFWDGNLNGMDYWVILAKSEHIDTAYKWLAYYATPEPQIAFAQLEPLGPSSIAAWDGIPADQMAVLPHPDAAKMGVFTGDPTGIEFWVDNIQELSERWEAWIGQ
jgi:putative spermidine/putrescine transport system substrate-binding protein